MTHNATITISKTRAALYEQMLNWKDGDNADIRLSEEETITETAYFSDGLEMDIKICGVQYEGNGNDSAYTEAVLFTSNGSEICCTEPGDDFLGIWELENDGNKYIVEVKAA